MNSATTPISPSVLQSLIDEANLALADGPIHPVAGFTEATLPRIHAILVAAVNRIATKLPSEARMSSADSAGITIYYERRDLRGDGAKGHYIVLTWDEILAQPESLIEELAIKRWDESEYAEMERARDAVEAKAKRDKAVAKRKRTISVAQQEAKDRVAYERLRVKFDKPKLVTCTNSNCVPRSQGGDGGPDAKCTCQ